MIDIGKQSAYWRKGADEDWEAGKELIQNGRIRQGLFFIHLSLEKILKAHFCVNRRDVAPKSHNLVRLAEIGGVSLNETQRDILADINAFNIEGRYPDSYAVLPSKDEVALAMTRAEEIFLWLKNQF
ncbi:MAG: HEPN domain-containing protein [Nitrospinae bacterium]|nr:HEPN domain-containing protein [Nitrospinota bacterium]MBF0634036.1 HEPN domain-containing protein [Nitrospinota bacterium]